MSATSSYSVKALITSVLLICVATFVYASNGKFHSPYFDMPLNKQLTLILKNEQPNDGFYQYVFSSSNIDEAKLQMRVIVSSKAPEQNQSLEEFQTGAL